MLSKQHYGVVNVNKDEAKLAKGVVENYLAGADDRAAYWAVQLDMKLGIDIDEPSNHVPGFIANRFIEVVNKCLAQ